ncbi:Flagellar radial spoke protein 3 [Fasciolopsis buskii]|uniref:Flagellar radial spoke protein 3 n=1 Tax=Fasciolopsis buskii TaxID=27845 RepID=A0A8E0RP09_9TREM|nr:Flagellar radial spoke protein 3 [Fasciolopsis buski]
MADVLTSRNIEGTYSFASQPKAISNKRKFRPNATNEVPVAGYGNLMYDRRVVRGNTYAVQILPAQAQLDPVEFEKELNRRRREISKQRAKEKFRPTSPMPSEGRLHKPVQTELYLEALSEFVEDAEVECQTDKFLDRPPSPLFVPAKSGEDAGTQIYEGDLFDFDLEVIPILEILIGKTIEQALLEVIEEEELARIREQQVAFEELRQADLTEVQRLMEQERRIREEKEKRKAEAIRVAGREKELAAKVAAQAFSRAYLADLQFAIFKNLTENGYFYDPVEYDVETGFLPWLMDQIEDELEVERRARTLMDGLIREAVQERHYEYRRLELLEEDKSLSMSAGSALIQGNLTTGSPEFEKRSDELLAPNNGEDSVPKDSQAIQDETSDEPRLEETAEQPQLDDQQEEEQEEIEEEAEEDEDNKPIE